MSARIPARASPPDLGSPISLKIFSRKRYISSGEQKTSRDTRKTAPPPSARQRTSEPSLLLEAGCRQNSKIPTDWLTADWHEKAEPRRRRRRNVLPEAYRPLSKSDKQQVRAAAKWIRERVSLVDWGRKMPDAEAGKPLPKPVNFKEQVAAPHPGNLAVRAPQAHPHGDHPPPRR